jgi:hypothetical protein
MHCKQAKKCKRAIERNNSAENRANFYSQALKNNDTCDMYIEKERRSEKKVK